MVIIINIRRLYIVNGKFYVTKFGTVPKWSYKADSIVDVYMHFDMQFTGSPGGSMNHILNKVQ